MNEPRARLFSPGEVVAKKYRIERHLAEGGMGAVFIAENVDTERRVALKVLFPHVLSSPSAVKTFQLEARVAARVGSVNIVDVLDSGFDEERGTPYLAMELLEGETLHARVARQGPLAPAEAVAVLRQVSTALDRAHGWRNKQGVPQPIIHRDLKPDNLFLTTRDDGALLVKVLDFGIAKVLSAETAITKEIKGTPYFMAYEQVAGQPVSPKTDLSALGLIAFFLLTGQSYWRTVHAPEVSIVALFGEILALPLDAPSLRLAERGRAGVIPPAFDPWLLRCLERDPARRFDSAGVAVEALAELFGLGDVRLAEEAHARAAAMSPAPLSLPHAASVGSDVPDDGPTFVSGVPPRPFLGAPGVAVGETRAASATLGEDPTAVFEPIGSAASTASPIPRWLRGVAVAIAFVGVGGLLYVGLARPTPASIDRVSPAPSGTALTLASSAASLAATATAPPMASSAGAPPSASSAPPVPGTKKLAPPAKSQEAFSRDR